MKIKTYLVRSLSEAVEKIKKEMGPEAVILSTKKVEAKTHPLAEASMRLEVTAALYPIEAIEPMDLPSNAFTPQEAFRETRLPVARVPQERMASELKAAPNLSHGLSPIQEFFAIQNQKRIEEMEQAILSVCQKLSQQEIQSSLIHELSEKLLKEKEEFDLEKCQEMSALHLMKKMPQPLPFKRDRLEPSNIAFVGPTGSGKTTTLIKLALKYKLEGCESLAIVSIDYDALHRQEPLRRFADENDIPFYPITHESELTQHLSKFLNYEVILFDTEGCSPYDTARMTRLAQTCESLAPVQTALVLPIHLGSNDLLTIQDRFKPTGFDRLILTKLDETAAYGNLFHASYHGKVPLAYFTTGQRVPEDMEEATLERVMDCLFDFSGRMSMSELTLSQELKRHEETRQIQAIRQKEEVKPIQTVRKIKEIKREQKQPKQEEELAFTLNSDLDSDSDSDSDLDVELSMLSQKVSVRALPEGLTFL